MPFSNINGLKLHHHLYGDTGEPLILIHGYMGAAIDWRHQIEEFAGEYRVLVLDNRGHGQSEAPLEQSEYAVDFMVEDVVRLVELMGFDRYHLVGHSFGGAVAQEIALRNPNRLITLTLNDTTDSFADHDLPGGTPPYRPPELVKTAEERRARMSQATLEGGWRALIDWRGSAQRLQGISAPTLVIYGDRDASRIVEGSQRIAKLISHSRVEVIEGAGHSPQRERPNVYNAALRRFLRSAQH